MTTRISLEDVDPKVFTSELAPYTEYGIPIGTFYPDCPLGPEDSSGGVENLRRRRLAFFTFDETGKPKWALRDINYLGEAIKKVFPKTKFTPRDCSKNRHVDLFIEFRNQDLDAFERIAFSWLAKIHYLNVKWGWPTYKIMRDEPHRRLFREHQPKRLATGNYDVPNFCNADGTQDVELRELFMKRLEAVILWERQLRYEIDTHSGNTPPIKYARQRFRLAAQFADMMQTLLQNTEMRCILHWHPASDLDVAEADLPDPSVPELNVPSITVTPSEEVAPTPAPAAPTPGFLAPRYTTSYVPVSTATGDEHFAPSPSPGQAIDPMLRVDDSAMDWEQESLPEELKQAGLSLQAYGSEMPAATSDEMSGDWLPPVEHMYPEPPH